MQLEYFQLLDRVTSIDGPGNILRAQAAVPAESTIFEGHFPGRPLMPGVLLIECMAQAAGFCILSKHAFVNMPFLATVRAAKFRSFVAPGALLEIEAHLQHDGSGFTMASALVQSQGRRICDAELTFRIMPFPSEELRTAMRDRAIRLGIPAEPQ